MALRAALRDALGRLRRRPALLAAALLVVLGEVLAGAAAALLGGTLGVGWPGSLVLAQLGVAVVVPAPLVVAYELAADGRPQVGPLAAVRRGYPRLLAATLVQRAVVLAVLPIAVVAVHATALVAATGVDLARYALHPTARGLPAPRVMIVLIGLLVVLGGALAALPFVFYDVLALFGDRRPARAWLASARLARRRPRWLFGYGLVRGLLGVPAALVVLLGPRVAPGGGARPALVAALGATLLAVVVLSVAVRITYHVAVFKADVAGAVPAPAGLRALVPSRATAARGALALAVLVALVGGSAALRLTETRPYATPAATPIADDATPAAMFAGARRHIRRSSHRSVQRTVTINYTTGAEERTLVWHSHLDRRDHQFRNLVRAYHPNGTREDTELSAYLTDGTVANSIGSASFEGGPDSPLAFERSAGTWRVLAGPGYPLVHERANTFGDWLPAADADWRVVNRTGDRVTVAVTDPQAVRAATTFQFVGDGTVSNDSYVRATFDRETGRLRRVTERVRYRPSTEASIEPREGRRVTTFRAYGRADLRRPPALGAPNLRERLWDLAYY